MVKYKLFGILSMFVFSLPKVLPVFSSSTVAISSAKENPTQTPIRKLINKIPIREVPVVTKPIEAISVTASVYFPVESQTDSTPLITADNSRIKHKEPSKHRWVAVSRNLLRRWGGKIDYGDTLHVKGISDVMDGPYIVRDTMNRRMKNRIDILVGPQEKIMGIWENVKIYQMSYKY